MEIDPAVKQCADGLYGGAPQGASLALRAIHFVPLYTIYANYIYHNNTVHLRVRRPRRTASNQLASV